MKPFQNALSSPPWLALAAVVLSLTAKTQAGTLTMGNYTGTIPPIIQGEFNQMPGASASGGAGDTFSASSTATGGTLFGQNTPNVYDDWINTGFGTRISLTLDPGETIASQSLSLSLGGGSVGFDDGIRIYYNGTTILDFDYDDYSTDADVSSLFNGGSWEPWTNAGMPEIEFDGSGLRLMVTAQSDGTGSAAGILAGQRVNLLEHFDVPTLEDSGILDFLSGVDLAIFDRNQSGDWAMVHPTVTASVTLNPLSVPEPSAMLLSGMGLAGLILRRKR